MYREPKYKTIVHFVEDRIRQGELKLGDHIPSVNAFRIRFGLSRSSIFLAMQELKSRGIIEAEPAVGYFVISDNIQVEEKVLLLFNELNAFKEELYTTILEEIGNKAKVEIMFHHYDRHVFETLLRDAEGRFTSYVLMPGKFRGLAPVLDRIQGKVFLLDHYQDDICTLFPGVRQDFEQDTYDALLQGLDAIGKYHTLALVQRDVKEPEERYKGIRRFCEEFGFGSLLVPTITGSALHKGTLYLTPSDGELAAIIKKADARHLEIGSDIGVISFNDTPLKEVLCGGITTLSTDFCQMGRTLSALVVGRHTGNGASAIRNPWMLIRRRSL